MAHLTRLTQKEYCSDCSVLDMHAGALEGEPLPQKERDVAPMATGALEHSLNEAEVLANYAVRNNISGVQDAIGGMAA